MSDARPPPMCSGSAPPWSTILLNSNAFVFPPGAVVVSRDRSVRWTTTCTSRVTPRHTGALLTDLEVGGNFASTNSRRTTTTMDW